MHLIELAYDAALTLVRPIVELGARRGRAARALEGRRESLGEFRRWARQHRNLRLPLIWVHAPSVGESLMASAIIGALRKRADVQVAFTIFSPSAERIADGVGADVNAYLPWDTRRDVRNALGILDPSVVAFIRTEIWPTLAREAKARRARAVLLNAPLAETSSRLKPIARSALAVAYRRLDAVGAVSREDIERFMRLGVPREHIQVTGDARFDQVLARVARVDRDAPLLVRLSVDSRPALVAGSTWPEDEDLLIRSWPDLELAGVRLIIAPHEPRPAHLDRLDGLLETAGITHARLAELEADPRLAPDAVVIDRVGALADIYSVGRLAWVGGGFGTRGLHSVIEPAALGLPVLFGPAHGNAREAAELVAAGGGAIIETEADVGVVVRSWLRDEAPGRAARQYVEQNAGAAERNAQIILDFLPEPPSRPTVDWRNRGKHG